MVLSFKTLQPHPIHTLDVAGGLRIERLRYFLIMVHIDWGGNKLQTVDAATTRNPHQSRSSLRFEGQHSFEIDVPLVEETPRLDVQITLLVTICEIEELIVRFRWSKPTIITLRHRKYGVWVQASFIVEFFNIYAGFEINVGTTVVRFWHAALDMRFGSSFRRLRQIATPIRATTLGVVLILFLNLSLSAILVYLLVDHGKDFLKRGGEFEIGVVFWFDTQRSSGTRTQLIARSRGPHKISTLARQTSRLGSLSCKRRSHRRPYRRW